MCILLHVAVIVCIGIAVLGLIVILLTSSDLLSIVLDIIRIVGIIFILVIRLAGLRSTYQPAPRTVSTPQPSLPLCPTCGQQLTTFLSITDGIALKKENICNTLSILLEIYIENFNNTKREIHGKKEIL
ncbi:MAG: hypothetical protein QXU67_05875 [Candidatus Bathyarchaeia archaeon]